jgi:hypothetical protein
MRKPHIAVVLAVLGAFLAFGATGASAEKIKKKKVVETNVTVAFKAGPVAEEYTGSTFSGDVTSPKAKCVRARGITVQRVNGPTIGQTQSGSDGSWTATVGTAEVRPGEQYAVQVAKSKIIKEKTKPNGDHVKKKIVCQPASETITIP